MDLMTPFDITYDGEELHVVPRKAGPDTVYMIHFPGRRPPMMLTRATRQGGRRFWTPIPEEKGRTRQDAALKEAAALGDLIAGHYAKLSQQF